MHEYIFLLNPGTFKMRQNMLDLDKTVLIKHYQAIYLELLSLKLACPI